MEAIMNQIMLYHRLSIVCFAGMVISIIATFLIYKREKIKGVLEYFWRNRKKVRIWMFAFLCGIFLCGSSMPVFAVQTEVPPAEDDLEESKDLPPVLETFFIGGEEQEISYTSKEVPVKIVIRDEQESFDESRVLLEYSKAGTEEWKSFLLEAPIWDNQEEGVFETICMFDRPEGTEEAFELRVNYTDSAGNEMIADEGVMPIKRIVIDKKAPAYEAAYTDENGQLLISKKESIEILPYYNAAEKITFDFKISEKYLDKEKSSVKIIITDKSGNVLKEESLEIKDETCQTVLCADGHYRVSAYLVDTAGNETIHEKKFALDYDPPKQPKIKYSTEGGGILERAINQLTFGYFAREKVTAHIQVEDTVSGVKQIVCTFQDVETQELVTETVLNPEQVLEVELPLSFKGNLRVQSEDHMGNKAEIFSDIGVIAESEDTHKVTSDAEIKVLTDYSKTPGYYAEDVKLEFYVKDTYSGIQSVSYLAGKTFSETYSYEEKEKIVTEEVVKAYTLLSSENPENNVQLGLSFLDNAGHETILSEENLPKIHIDTAAPKVRVVYDNYDVRNDKYYKESRTAIIYIEEKNFDPEDVHFDLGGPVVEVHSWSHNAGEGCEGGEDPYHTEHSISCVWSCKVDFIEDGEYHFGFSCVDLAGNEGGYGQIDEFVIDQTAPVIRVSYDNYDVRNEIYYRTPRIARITIAEKNFRPEDVKLSVSAENESQALDAPGIMAWTSNGEMHQTVISYDYDAVFTFDIEYMDLAGNEAADYPGDYFCVDMTRPQIIISGVTDKSANNGAISPLITITDTNYSNGNSWFELLGWKNGIVDVTKASANISGGVIVKIQDLSHTEENDDLYRLSARAADLAGNIAEVQIRFSLNRFGSVYTLDKITEALAGEEGTYYTKQEKSLTITETNVDTLLFKEIICSLNGKLTTLKEGADFIVEESGDETGWKQYRYIINADNFTQEGHYTLTVYSEDRAGNLSDNQSKGKSISFAVDKSAPSIVISGVEHGGRYRENIREIFLDVEDNLALSKVTVTLNGEVQVYDMETLNKTDGKIEIIAKSNNEWQMLKVEAEDRTGNGVSVDEITFLVTPNLLVQFYNHKPLFYGSIGVAALAFGAIGCFGFMRYKRKKNV